MSVKPTKQDISNNKFGINETNTASSYQSKSQSESPNIAQYADFQSLEKDAKRVLHKIPVSNQIYITHAINDFYKQVEEYETWKVNTGNFYLNGP